LLVATPPAAVMSSRLDTLYTGEGCAPPTHDWRVPGSGRLRERELMPTALSLSVSDG